MQYHFINVAWGDAYLDLLLNVSLPSQLTPGNLDVFDRAHGSEARYRIYTMPDDVGRITSSPAYAALLKRMHVDLVVNEKLSAASNRYAIMNLCHNHAIHAANEHDAALVLLAPDTVWSEGTFAAVKRIAESGRRVVLMHAPRLLREPVVSLLRERVPAAGEPVVPTHARELVRLMIEHAHPFTRSLFWDSPDYNRWASHLYWPVNDEGLLVRSFHLHPLLIHPRNKNVYLQSTIDSDYIRLACPDPADQHIVLDSDEICAIELTSESFNVTPYVKPDGSLRLREGQSHPAAPKDADLKAVAVAFFAQQKAGDWHRQYLNHAIRLHATDCTAAWNDAQQRSQKVAGEILDWTQRDAQCVLNDVFAGRLD